MTFPVPRCPCHAAALFPPKWVPRVTGGPAGASAKAAKGTSVLKPPLVARAPSRSVPDSCAAPFLSARALCAPREAAPPSPRSWPRHLPLPLGPGAGSQAKLPGAVSSSRTDTNQNFYRDFSKPHKDTRRKAACKHTAQGAGPTAGTELLFG